MRHENRERLMALMLAVLQLGACVQQANLTAQAGMRPAEQTLRAAR